MPADPSDETSTQPPAQASVHGIVEFPEVGEPAEDVTIHVRVEDASRADAPALTVAEHVLRGVSLVPGSQSFPFTVRGIPPNPRARYLIRVHADVDGDGRVSRGDYVSMQSHPVLTNQPSATVTIVVRKVG